MNPMDLHKLLKLMQQVLSQDVEKIGRIFQFSGGWEIWFQCEIACICPVGSVLREVPLWNDKRACDLTFEDGFAVELKCPGLLRVQTSTKHGGMTFGSTKSGINQLIVDIVKDQGKINEYVTKNPGKKGAAIVVIASVSAFDPLVTKLQTENKYNSMGLHSGYRILYWAK